MSTLNSIQFGNNIRRRRKALGLSQYQLAELLGVSPNHVSSLETGKSEPSNQTVINLCNALDVTPDYFYLGCMHSNNVRADITDLLRRCSDEDQKIIYDIIRIFANKNK